MTKKKKDMTERKKNWKHSVEKKIQNGEKKKIGKYNFVRLKSDYLRAYMYEYIKFNIYLGKTATTKHNRNTYEAECHENLHAQK